MNESTKKYLSDILEAIGNIEMITVGIQNLPDFERDIAVRWASERLLITVGEALNKAKQSDASLKIEHAAKIIAHRNRLVHAYDAVDITTVWSIVTRHLSPLKTEVENLLYDHNH